MQIAELIGLWALVSMTIHSSGGKSVPAYKNPHGYILFTKEGFVSVGLNANISGAPTPETILANSFFYMGKYKELKPGTTETEILNAWNPAMIGKKLIRHFERVDKNTVRTHWSDEISSGEIVWRKASDQ
jgi:hypothetical protein